MLDGVMRKLIDPPLNTLGQSLAKRGVTANAMTALGLALGVVSAVLVAFHLFWLALLVLLLSRIADGLDGAVARASQKTDFGGFFDITADFLFYGAIPLGFVIADPAANGVAGAFLLASFYFNGATFLGYSVLAERKGLETTSRGAKTLYFTGGILEGTETIVFFALLCLLPFWFAPLAFIFGALCYLTAASRMLLAWQVFGKNNG